MKSFIHFTLASLFIIGASKLQAQDFRWAVGFGETGNAFGYSIAVDATGNVFTIDNFNGTVDLDPGSGTFNLTSAGNKDVYVQKLDSNGNFLWAKAIGGSGNDFGSAIAIDPTGNIYITGNFNGTADFDPGSGTYNMTSAGNNDIFIQKMDNNGNFLWAKAFGGTDKDFGISIAVDVAGNVYTTGYFSGTADFDPGSGIHNLTSIGNNDMFIQKLDSNGNFLWAKSVGGGSYAFGYSVAVDAAGNVFTTGKFAGTVDFDPGSGTHNLNPVGIFDIFILKLDNNGNFQWAHGFGSGDQNAGYSIAVDAAGNVYTVGNFNGTIDFDPGIGTYNLSPVGGNDIFVQKLDANGNFLWAKAIGGNYYDIAYSIAVDAASNVYITGEFYTTVDFDPGSGTYNITSAGQSDIFIQKMDSNGNFKWAKSYGSNNYDYGLSIATDAANNVYTKGGFNGTVNFNQGVGVHNLTSAGDNDIFLLKLSQTIHNTGHDVETAENNTPIRVFPNPAKEIVNIETNLQDTYSIVVLDALGKTVLHIEANQSNTTLSIANLSKGVYLIQIQNQNSIHTAKLLIE